MSRPGPLQHGQLMSASRSSLVMSSIAASTVRFTTLAASASALSSPSGLAQYAERCRRTRRYGRLSFTGAGLRGVGVGMRGSGSGARIVSLSVRR